MKDLLVKKRRDCRSTFLQVNGLPDTQLTVSKH